MLHKLFLLGFLLTLPIEAFAHHAFSAEYDKARKVTVQGTVVRFEWTNPHVWLYVDTKEADGKTVQWQCEGGSPNALTRAGWSKDIFKQGDAVTIDAYGAKDGTSKCNISFVKLSSGRRLFAGLEDETSGK